MMNITSLIRLAPTQEKSKAEQLWHPLVIKMTLPPLSLLEPQALLPGPLFNCFSGRG